jgi:hypothetical protein
MYTYSYSYKNIPDEIIGKVKAVSYKDAVEKIASIKQLPIEDINYLFLIYRD